MGYRGGGGEREVGGTLIILSLESSCEMNVEKRLEK